MHRNTAYWPERFTPASLCREAREWEAKARGYLDAAAKVAAHQSLRRNAGNAAERAAKNPTAANLNSAGSMGNLLADSADLLAAELAALSDPCPDPPASAIVYREPGEPPSWAAEAIVHDSFGMGFPRGSAAIRVHGYSSREEAIAAMREVAGGVDLARASAGSDYHAARARAAARAALETDPVEARIRAAGEPRPDDWETPR